MSGSATRSPEGPSRPSSRLGVALWGVGRWGRAWMNALTRSGEVELLWAIDPVPCERGLPDGVVWAGDPAVSLEDPRVEAVVVATPVETHGELALLAATRGRHVLVEKPVTTSAAILDVVLAGAQQAGRLVFVNHLLLHHPAFVRLEAELRAGTIGELRAITALRVSAGEGRLECPWWTLAPHDLALVDKLEPQLLDSEVALTARGAERRARLVDAAGREVHLAVSLCGARKARLFVVQGSRGTLVFDDLHHHALTLHPKSPLVDAEPVDERRLRSRLGFGRALELEPGKPLDRALAAFVRAVQTSGVTGAVEAAHMRRVVSALERGCSFRPVDARIEVPA